MSETPREIQSPVVVKPQPDVYTAMLVIAIVALVVTVGIVLWNLLSSMPEGYGLTFSAIFDQSKLPMPAR